MNRQQAETILTTHLHAIFGFALKRCKSIHDAEDLSQEIALRRRISGLLLSGNYWADQK